jgi:Mn-containing catalase
VQSPAIAPNGDAVADPENAGASMHAESTGSGNDALEELLVDQLRDILHAEKQLSKALPKMVKAAHSEQLQLLFEVHLGETEAQAERLNECLRL